MANIISLNGSFQASVSGGSPIIPLSIAVTMVGSNATWDVKDMPSGTVSSINTSSLNDLRYFVADNVGTASLQIATDVAMTKIIGTLQPNDNIVIPWSGSIATSTLFCKPVNSGSTLAYMVVES